MSASNWKWPRAWLFVAAVVVAGAILWTAYSLLVLHGEVGDKPIYADLQGLELSRRSSSLNAPTVVFDSPKHPILGIPTDDPRFPNAWIAATVAKPDGSVYAVLPRSAHLRLQCDQVSVLVEEVNKRAQMASEVRKYLNAICQPQKAG
jgi:hypothetical protein